MKRWKLVGTMLICLALVACGPRIKTNIIYQPLTQSTFKVVPIIPSTRMTYYHQPHRWYKRNIVLFPSELLHEFFGQEVHLSSTHYAVVPKDVVFVAFSDFRKEMFGRYGLLKRHHTFQCAAWTQAFMDYIAKQHYLSNQPHDNNAACIAIGELWFWPDRATEKGHAINVILQVDGNNIIVWFFDPLLGKEVVLTESEVKSIWYIKF